MYQPFEPTPFSFSLTEEAATHNSAIIKSHDFDSTTTMDKLTPGTQLQYGLELRPASDLKYILHHHPLWKKIELLLTHGSIIPSLIEPNCRQRRCLVGSKTRKSQRSKQTTRCVTQTCGERCNTWFCFTHRSQHGVKHYRWRLGTSKHCGSVVNQ